MASKGPQRATNNAVAFHFADNIGQGLERQRSSMSSDDLALAAAMFRQTAGLLTTDRGDNDESADIDPETAEYLSATAAILKGMLTFVA